MPWEEIGLIVIGAIIGFILSILAEFIRRKWDRKNNQLLANKIIQALIKEIEEGIERCEGLIRMKKKNQVSFSRVYISFWDSVKLELCKNEKNLELLKILHLIYYRFDLINFNMERNEFAVGASFAEQYISEIKDNLAKAKELLPEK